MIVGADIEMGMVFPVVPANVFFLIHPVRAVCAPYCFGFIDLSEQPTPGNNGVGFQKFS